MNDIDTLAEIGEVIGLNPNSLREAIESHQYEQQIINETEEAQRMGVTGIPCFVSGTRGVMGAQNYDTLMQLINEE
ncbi:hypothetical protein GH741_03735 [Aquibacillus halophilus]|uniref:DSBA-like thioredoxin domain-containing protein n=1 Tax=Aquibacillus halophilus TaxID=930132 RepID=A0A6A8DKK7_9BACI|nr:hypothetical protein [Aquibacillus halophilus]